VSNTNSTSDRNVDPTRMTDMVMDLPRAAGTNRGGDYRPCHDLERQRCRRFFGPVDGLSSHEKPVAAQNPGTLGRSSSHSHLRIPRHVAIDTATGVLQTGRPMEGLLLILRVRGGPLFVCDHGQQSDASADALILHMGASARGPKRLNRSLAAAIVMQSLQ
jgi:hypothetical protein